MMTDESITVPASIARPDAPIEAKPCWIVTLEIETFPAVNSEDSVQVVAVDDGVARARALDREIACDVERAGGVVHFVGAGDRDCVKAPAER